MILKVVQGFDEVGIAYGEGVGTQSLNDFDGRDFNELIAFFFAVHQAFEQMGALPADGVGGEINAGAGRKAEMAKDAFVIAAENGNFMGDFDPFVGAKSRKGIGEFVAGGEDRDWLGKVLE